MNPVKRGLRERCTDRKWSSARFHVDGVVDPDLPKLHPLPCPGWIHRELRQHTDESTGRASGTLPGATTSHPTVSRPQPLTARTTLYTYRQYDVTECFADVLADTIESAGPRTREAEKANARSIRLHPGRRIDCNSLCPEVRRPPCRNMQSLSAISSSPCYAFTSVINNCSCLFPHCCSQRSSLQRPLPALLAAHFSSLRPCHTYGPPKTFL